MGSKEQDEVMDVTDHDVTLTASVAGNRVRISGTGGGGNLRRNSGAHRFRFTLNDPTGLNVSFASLDTEDNCSTCPPSSGQNSQQIVGVQMNNGLSPKTAAFTDNNNNKVGPMDVSYQWNFTCNDSSKTVESFDPIITNGGQD